ncbi:MAG: hypothetical protein AB8G23_01655 [Myxococcota bacterium]
MSPNSLVQAARGVARTIFRERPRNNFIHRWRRSLFGDPGLPSDSVGSVLVLCHGNLFRSPFAAALLDAHVPGLTVTSGGLHAADGHTSPQRAIDLASGFGIDLNDHRTTPISARLVAEADLIIVMEGAHRAELARIHPDVLPKIRILGDFLAASPRDLPDPWAEDEVVGRVIFARVKQAAEALAIRLEAREGTHDGPASTDSGRER